jgi:hypothetical protein
MCGRLDTNVLVYECHVSQISATVNQWGVREYLIFWTTKQSSVIQRSKDGSITRTTTRTRKQTLRNRIHKARQNKNETLTGCTVQGQDCD